MRATSCRCPSRDAISPPRCTSSSRGGSGSAFSPTLASASPCIPKFAAPPRRPYEAELAAPANDPRDALPPIAFTVAYNMSEQPAASINWGTSSEGLPIGVQLVGHRFDDAGVLRLARLVEELRPAQRRWPE